MFGNDYWNSRELSRYNRRESSRQRDVSVNHLTPMLFRFPRDSHRILNLMHETSRWKPNPHDCISVLFFNFSCALLASSEHSWNEHSDVMHPRKGTRLLRDKNP